MYWILHIGVISFIMLCPLKWWCYLVQYVLFACSSQEWELGPSVFIHTNWIHLRLAKHEGRNSHPDRCYFSISVASITNILDASPPNHVLLFCYPSLVFLSS
jgi:hypothetical protein